MKNALAKFIITLFIANLTAVVILIDNSDITNSMTTVQVTAQETERKLPELIDLDSIDAKAAVLTHKQGNFTIEASEEIIAKFTYAEEPVEEPVEEYVYEPTTEELLEAELDLLPDGLLEYLYDNGWEIELTDMNLSEEFDYPMSICGITLYDEKRIYITDGTYYIRRVTLHEVGHAFAYESGKMDLTKEFKEIYNEEKDNFVDCTSIGDGHETSDVREYFASVFQNMFLDYEETYNSVPETVNYIESIVYNII